MLRLSLKRDTLADSEVIWTEEDVGGPQRETPDYLERNRGTWHRWAGRSVTAKSKAWRTDELEWGLWSTPESQLRLLLALAPDADVVELGCGAAAVCAWLKRGGMHPVGLDFSPAQLMAAEQLQREFGVFFPLISANAEDVLFDRESFDVAISEYGASI